MSDMKQKSGTEEGSLDESDHQEGMQAPKTLPLFVSISGADPHSEVLVERTAGDVLCGRGVQVLHHAGNLQLHLAADEFREEYLSSRRDRKKSIIDTIVNRLKSTGSRFLKTAQADKTKWVEADDTFAYQKVSHVLRGQNTGKAVKKIKKQESEIAKRRIGHTSTQQALQGATAASNNTSQLLQVANVGTTRRDEKEYDYTAKQPRESLDACY
ncbi:MAG: hypothetical protein SGBAC_008100 [Bacillariaceae sp.]